MKKLLLVLLLLCSSAFAQMQEEVTRNNQGQMFIRIHNTSSQYYSCYYEDDINYVTFVLAPYSVSGWQPVYGFYVWECS